MANDWASLLARARDRVADGERRLAGADAAARERQLTRLGNASNAAALCLLMLGRTDESAEWFRRAAAWWRESYDLAPAGAWGRLIGAVKARLLADDAAGASVDAEWVLTEGAAASDSPIGRYAACLALLVLDRDDEAAGLAASLYGLDDFPTEVADALAALAARDGPRYAGAAAAVLELFESRNEYLEDVPVADTVLVLQALAGRRGITAELSSQLLPR